VFSTAQAVIAAMITPALLILASASLIATVLVRLARVVDRVRKLGEAGAVPLAELDRHDRRAVLAERALTLLFVAIVCFVADGLAIALDRAAAGTLTWLPIALTVLGMALLAGGAGAMIAECQLATVQIRAEIAALRTRAARGG
jgi:hypothetical protein